MVDVKNLLKGQEEENSFTKLPKLPYAGAILDCEYALDSKNKWTPNAFLPGQFKQFLPDFESLTSSEDWVAACLCGLTQLTAFYNAAKEVCNDQVEKMFWLKSLDSPSLRQMSDAETEAPIVYPNRVETFIMCYYTSKPSQEGGKHGDQCRKKYWMKNERILEEMKDSAHALINPHQKPLQLIYDIINVHMRGPEKIVSPACPLVQPAVEEVHWILDAPGCGSGTASGAANSLGLGSVAFDRLENQSTGAVDDDEDYTIEV
ncbi:hypothetical protein CYMTET_44068 [Cymbomonas tetramitiformis]|uniref:Uncharacterized protein n=1 Tax=Cymbomonas tetramitiformis TaxID=36881 RepID=A0AAE0C2L9_9CHLO|nr:hypothetical protein CYMTET_44068 [Cymbomonas tetramitiformis]